MNVVSRRCGQRALEDADQVVARVGDDDVAVRPYGHTGRRRQLRQDRRAAVAELARLAGAGDGAKDIVRHREFADHVVAGIGDVEVRPIVECQPGRHLEQRRSRHHAVEVAGDAGSRHDRERVAHEVEATDDIVIGIGDVKAVAIDRQAARLLQRGAHQRGNRARTVDDAHPVVERVGDVDLAAFGVPRDAIRGIQLGGRRQATVAGKSEAAGPGDGADHGRRRAARAIDRRNRDGRLADLVAEGVGNIDVEAGHLVADLGYLPDRHRIGPRKLRLGWIAAITLDRHAASAGKGELAVIDQ